jgi:hypothetical protein
VAAAVCADGKAPIVFVPEKVKINSKVYQDKILAPLRKWMKKVRSKN